MRLPRTPRGDQAPDVVEQRLEHEVMSWLDPVAPDRLAGAGGLTVDGAAEQRAPRDALDLEPVLAAHLGRADDAEGAHGAGSVALPPAHRWGEVQLALRVWQPERSAWARRRRVRYQRRQPLGVASNVLSWTLAVFTMRPRSQHTSQ
jgi:hypothetical protein